MPFNKSAVSLLIAVTIHLGAATTAGAEGIPDVFKSPSKVGDSSLIKSKQVKSDDKDVPDWLKDSKRLNAMLGDNADAKIENAKVVRKVETPIPGLDGFVVQADAISKANPEGKQELYVFYTDKSRRYLMVGMMIDMEKERDLNQMVERYVRGEMADNPAKALRPQDMHGITIPGSKGNKSAPVQFVVDIGPEAGKKVFLAVVNLHKALLNSGKNVRPLRVVPVSAGKDELSTGAMAISMGVQKLNGDGMSRLVEFAEKGASTSWMDGKRLKKDAKLKQAIGLGIFQMEDNSTQALLAHINTLPLVYDGQGEQVKSVVLPSSAEEWNQLLVN